MNQFEEVLGSLLAMHCFVCLDVVVVFVVVGIMRDEQAEDIVWDAQAFRAVEIASCLACSAVVGTLFWIDGGGSLLYKRSN
jgi:hypothetical protein